MLAPAVVAVPEGGRPAVAEEWSTAMPVSGYAPQGLYTGLEILNSPSEKFASLVE